jgi:predicted DNA-binding protein with PD1-like motif
MRYCETRDKRVFILRLEDGEMLQDCIELFAASKDIRCAKVYLLGGVDAGSILIVGAEKGRAKTIQPMRHLLPEMYEAVGNGTIFPDQKGIPRLHCHLACGRKNHTICGEIRDGVKVWHVMEVVITELDECDVLRKKDPVTGFELLFPANRF